METATRVLLVDDDEEDFLLTRDIIHDIEQGSYVLEWVESAVEARAILESNPPDICLLDYRLGPENGIALIPEFIGCGFQGPIIMLTGQKDQTLENAALAAGAVDYLSKQAVDPYQLERALRYALMRKKVEVHERERLHAESKRREAEAANLAKSEFLAYISHELRTPLAAVLSYADLLALKTAQDELVEYTHAITRNGRHLLALLDDMLDLSRIEAGKLELEIERTPLGPIVADVASTAEVHCKKKGLDFRLELPDTLPAEIDTDRKRLTQMLFNLVGNAIKFTDHGSVSLRLSFDERRERSLRFEIEDTGQGIPSEDLESIFEPFHRIATPSSDSQGAGLGLTITHRLADYLDVDLDVRSQPGRGTCFVLSLKPSTERHVDAVDRSTLNLSTGLAEQISKLDGLIVVVDDVEDIRIGVSELLRSSGANVVAMQSGSELIELIHSSTEFPPDLILLDMQMPETDGYDTAREIRAGGVRTPIIALTAAALEGARECCLSAGCDDYLSKPVEPGRLFERVSHWLEEGRRRRGDTSSAQTATNSGNPQILVVDDSADGREALGELLAHAGFSVSLAATEQEAESAIRTTTPDAVILDLNLGPGSGIDLAHRLSDENHRPKLLALSGRSLQELADSDRAVFDAFLAKPTELNKVIEALTSCGISIPADSALS
ncbi:MAG: response regulator [Gammaproteobacteria bacterium]